VQNREVADVRRQPFGQRDDDGKNHRRGANDRRADEHRLRGRLERVPCAVVLFEQLLGAFDLLLASGRVDPEDLADYRANQGYRALERVVTSMTPAEVLDEIVRSGLRGRGGAGYPTGLKWRTVAKAPGDSKYVICNADEGDPGAFMDRSVLESDPQRVLEGMAIAGYAVGASRGYVYCRAEYPLAVARLKTAIREAGRAGLLGEEIADTRFGFHVEIRLGAGAFVCGEETALIASVQGGRGTPTPRPPWRR